MEPQKDEATGRTRQIVVISAGVSQPSSTHLLADQFVRRVLQRAEAAQVTVEVRQIELRPLAQQIVQAMISGLQSVEIAQAIDRLATADAIVVATPIYKAGMSGLLKSFLDILDQDLLLAKPTALLATAGTARHALVVDEQLRSTMAFFRTLTIPTSVFSTSEDWGSASLGGRLDRAASELVVLLASDVARAITSSGWQHYQHEFGSVAEQTAAVRGKTSAGDAAGLDFDSDLMRLAAGGQ
ncbi:NADH-dependent FMN reductase [Pseudoclavibacter sp. CFCC 13796]|uniref:CE1759 family FMN reductase n=1 Tax=unclassified Pseudoclavibacter TaxID=2615177 RepID=UPI001300F961|nr:MULTISPECIES: CE1759 family FMN reductase [unclassified Pseudoclavibacter]KAB1661436.1 NADH-dependent FMN reductase [Pseudoclavibacter sp. CFCC 13796]MCD7100689.1 NAD(P)H-dependent oxidoreductase [Pseudoclavibacter sp. 13-3]